METEVLIRALSADAAEKRLSLGRTWWLAIAIAVVVAAVVFQVTLGVRPDFGHAVHTLRFVFKFVVTIALAATAIPLLRALSQPVEVPRTAWLALALAPALLLIAAGLELTVSSPDNWRKLLVGSNIMVCLTYIPLIGIGPLAIFLAMLRYGAPFNATRAGAVAGLLAGGVSATFYAAQCIDDSPLFVMTWYTLAITGLAVVGAAIAARIARW